jgi:hypothetical protein
MSPPLVVLPVLYALAVDMPEGRGILYVPYVLVEPMLLWRVWGHVLSVMPVTTVIVVVVSAVIVSRVAIVTKDLINAAPAHQGPSQLQIIVVLVINAWQEHGRRVVVVVVLLVLLVNTLLLVLVAAPAAHQGHTRVLVLPSVPNVMRVNSNQLEAQPSVPPVLLAALQVL